MRINEKVTRQSLHPHIESPIFSIKVGKKRNESQVRERLSRKESERKLTTHIVRILFKTLGKISR